MWGVRPCQWQGNFQINKSISFKYLHKRTQEVVTSKCPTGSYDKRLKKNFCTHWEEVYRNLRNGPTAFVRVHQKYPTLLQSPPFSTNDNFLLNLMIINNIGILMFDLDESQSSLTLTKPTIIK